MIIICSVITIYMQPAFVYANTNDEGNWKYINNYETDVKRNVYEAMSVINEADYRMVTGCDIEQIYDEDIIAEYDSCTKEELIKEVYKRLNESEIITCTDDIEIRFVENEASEANDYCVVVESVGEVVNYLEATQVVVENGKYTTEEHKNNIYARAATTSTTQTLKKAITPVTTADLRATITYNTNTGVITGVTNRSLELSGVTLTTSMENVSTNYYLSPTKKYVKVTGDYTEVSGFITPIGQIEILRNHAYVQFKYNYQSGLYDAKGGYGYSDTSF